MSYGTVNAPEDSGRKADPAALPSQDGDHRVENENGTPHGGEQADGPDHSKDEQHQTAWQQLKAFFDRNIGLFFVFMAQVFASLVGTTHDHTKMRIVTT